MRFRMSAVQLESLIDEGQVTVSNPIRDSYFPNRYPNFNRVYGHGENHIAFIMLFIAITCKESYTGSNCGVEVCVPRDDATGHFSCDASQNKVCLPGYENPDTNCVDKIVTKHSTTICESTSNSGTMCCTSTLLPMVSSYLKPRLTSSHTDSLVSTPVVRVTSIASHSVGTPMSQHSPSPSVVVSTITGAVTMVTSNHVFHSVTTSISTHSPPPSDVAFIAGGVSGGIALLLLLVLFNIVLVLVIIKIKRRNFGKMVEVYTLGFKLVLKINENGFKLQIVTYVS